MVPDQRTLTLIGTLVVGMTLTSVLLLALEPGRRAPLSGIELTSIDPTPASNPTDRLFDTDTPLKWRSIIIHDTGTATGSARAINRVHERLGRGGLGYHFVINNGSEKDDGLIEVGFRWSKQMVGAYLEGPGADQWHRDSIGIVLVGNADRAALSDAQFRELVWLVQQLQKRFVIPANEVYVDLGTDSPGPARLFPHVRFQQQLLGTTTSGR